MTFSYRQPVTGNPSLSTGNPSPPITTRQPQSTNRTTVSIESALKHIKPRVRELGAYTLRQYDPGTKLNQNESPYDVPAELKGRLWERLAARPWNRYPPFVASDFIAAVAEATGWREEGVLVGNGSNELIQALLAAVVEPGVGVVIPEPTFTLYRLMTGVNGGTAVTVELDDELRFPVDAIVAAAKGGEAALIVLCSPNNPTGSALTRHEVERIHDETEAIVVLDQAYVEFGGYDAIPLLEGRPRLVILRTFSKAMSLAGLRAGYLLGDPALVREIAKAKLPYNVNFVTEAVAAEVLRSRQLLAAQVESIRSERDRLVTELARIPGLQVYPTAANFVLFRVLREDLDHRAVFCRLLEVHDVLVRDVSGYPKLERCLRVNAGTPAETEAFLNGMREAMSEGTR
jgi:histidinol-phosphate aminotransferase